MSLTREEYKVKLDNLRRFLTYPELDDLHAMDDCDAEQRAEAERLTIELCKWKGQASMLKECACEWEINPTPDDPYSGGSFTDKILSLCGAHTTHVEQLQAELQWQLARCEGEGRALKSTIINYVNHVIRLEEDLTRCRQQAQRVREGTP